MNNPNTANNTNNEQDANQVISNQNANQSANKQNLDQNLSPEVVEQIKQIKQKMGEAAVRSVEISDEAINQKAMEVARERLEEKAKKELGIFRLLFGARKTSKEQRQEFKEEAGGIGKGIRAAVWNSIKHSAGRGVVFNSLRKKARAEIYSTKNVYIEDEKNGNGKEGEAMEELKKRIISEDGEIKEDYLLGKEKVEESKEGDKYYEQMKGLLKNYMIEVSQVSKQKKVEKVFNKYKEKLDEINRVFHNRDGVTAKIRGGKKDVLRMDNVEEVMENAKNLKNMRLGEEAVDAYLKDSLSVKSVKAELGLNIKETADITNKAIMMCGVLGFAVVGTAKWGSRFALGVTGVGAVFGGATGILREKRKQEIEDKKMGYGEKENDGRLLDLKEAVAVFGKYVSTDKNGKMNMATLADEGRKELIEIVGKVKAYIELSKEKGERLFRTNDRSNLEKEIRQLMEAYSFSENYLTKTGWAGNNSEDQLKQNIEEIEKARKDILDGKIVKKEVNGKEVDEKEVGLREKIEKDKKLKMKKKLKAGLIGGIVGAGVAFGGVKTREFIGGMMSANNASESVSEEVLNNSGNKGNFWKNVEDMIKDKVDKGEDLLNQKTTDNIEGIVGENFGENGSYLLEKSQQAMWIDDVDGGKDLLVFRNGKYESLFADGNEMGLKIDGDGRLSEEELATLFGGMKKIGYDKYEKLESLEGHILYDKKSVSLEQFFDSEEGKSLESIVRTGWIEEGTIGDVKMAGGGYVVPVSEFNGGNIAGARLFISINENTENQGWYFDVVDGQVKIPADHPAASLFAPSENGTVSFNGRFMELTRESGSGQEVLTTTLGNDSVTEITSYSQRVPEVVERYRFINAEGEIIEIKSPLDGTTEQIRAGVDWDDVRGFKGYGGLVRDYENIKLGNGDTLKTRIVEGGYDQKLDHFFANGKDHPLSAGDRLYEGIWDEANPPSVVEMTNKYIEGAASSPNGMVDLAYGMGVLEDMSLVQRNELVEALCTDDEAFDNFSRKIIDLFQEKLEGGSVEIETIKGSNILSTFGYVKENGLVDTGVGEVYKENVHLLIFKDKNGESIIDFNRFFGKEGGGRAGVLAECRQFSQEIIEEKIAPSGPEPKIPKPTEPRPIPERPVPGGPKPNIPKPTGPRPNIPKDDDPIPKDTPNYENPNDGGGGYDNGDGTSITGKGPETNAGENVTKLGVTEEAAPLEKTEVKTGVNYEEMEAIERPENVASASDQEFGVEEGARIKTDDNGRAVVDGVVDENTSTRYTEDTGIWEEGRKSDVPPAIDASDVTNEVNTGTRTINSNTATETVIENQSNAGTDTGSYNSEVNAGGTSSGSDSDLSSGSQQTGDDNNLNEEELAKRLKELRGW